MWNQVHSITSQKEGVSFQDALDIWIKKPHVVNRRLCGTKILWHLSEPFTSGSEFCDLICEELYGLQNCTEQHSATVRSLLNLVCLNEQGTESDNRLTSVWCRDLLPKDLEKHKILREIIIDNGTSNVYFLPLELHYKETVSDIPRHMGYRIQKHDDNTVWLYIYGEEDAYDGDCELGYTLAWLRDTLLVKLSRWSQEPQLNTDITSLRLVPIDKYNQLYQELKKKYGVPLVQKWPERTDPQKFVYEDVAIAAYLLLMWENDRVMKKLSKKQSFVDLGCGNGLLVYILTSEGHPGLGLDIRKRNIWEMFGEKFNLQERTVMPSDENTFPEYDWLIGNHSDELTPWIPVMSARSSYESCYFVLPCCPWDFCAKFSQRTGGQSQYSNYLDFVQQVGDECGFVVEKDTLRIPSTKRTCFIGRSRTYCREKGSYQNTQLQEYINRRCSLYDKTMPSTDSHLENTCKCEQPQFEAEAPSDSLDICEKCGLKKEKSVKSEKRKWASDFKARSKVETSRNGISVNQEVKDNITSVVFNKLLALPNENERTLIDGSIWNQGGSMLLEDVAKLFDKMILQQLKNECGGIQTMLRNCHHIFKVQGGKVQLRNWCTDDYEQRKSKKFKKSNKNTMQKPVKKKLCFFHENHPQGCPQTADACKFAHGVINLEHEKTAQ